MTSAPDFDRAPDRLLELATEHHRAGELEAAGDLYRRLLRELPEPSVAEFRLGLIDLQRGEPAAALARIERAIDARPTQATYHAGRGQVLGALRRWAEAAEAYEQSLQLDPRDVAALRSLGSCRRLLGDLDRAEDAYRRVLELVPRDPVTLANLGTLLMERGRLAEALPLLEEVVELEPLVALHAVNLGIALCRAMRYAEAEALLRRALALEPELAEAAFNLGIALQGLGRNAEAVEQYRQAAARRPGYAAALINLGNASRDCGEFVAAAEAYEAALAADPESVAALNNSACLHRTLGRLDEAEARLRRALDLEPRNATLHNNLGNVLKDAGDIDRALECFRRALAFDPDAVATHGNLAYSLAFQSLDPREILAECLRFDRRFAKPLTVAFRPHANDRSRDRRLRIGYVSPDFRDHCQALFTIPLLSRHDHAGFEIHAYSSVERPDGYTRRIAGYSDAWHDVRTVDDATLAEQIRDDRIDILVDLTMHMADGRPLLFARRPAPVQVAWLAYPGTTGLDAIDYRLTDPRLDPTGFAGHYSERSAWLPDTFWIYDPLTGQPSVNPLPASTRGYVTFGCLNNPCKITDQTLRLWAKILRALPDSRLLLMAPAGGPRARALQRLAAHDIRAERIAFVPFRPRGEYLRTYHEIDLGLDTFPYNGHTTSLDSYWMGVPVVSRVGATCVGRGGLSQLYHLDLLDLAAGTDARFVDAAVGLATDLPRLAALRAGLRKRLERSRLMDAERFTRNLEAFYRRAWREFCAG